MNTRDVLDPEKGLSSLSPGPVPPGLRERVLSSVRLARERAVLTPRMKAAALAGLLIIFGSLAGEAVLDRGRLGEVLTGHGEERGAVTAPAEDVRLLAGEAGIEGRLLPFRRPDGWEERERELMKARELMKGWDEP